MRSDDIPEIGSVELEVPSLGTIKGVSYNNKIIQYLGIPYANIPSRFRRSVPAKAPWKDGQWDGTKLGPYCPQPPRDFYPIPAASRPWLEPPVTDEFKCLNLNISVPRLPTDNGDPLPVMVFVHGGAFVYAAGNAPMYDGRLLAANSEAAERPTIIVTLNYRLGVYGFLAGRDLEAYNKEQGEAGVGNYGIWDQVLALRWIQSHISAFGGDPKRVTLFGQSAGGVSVNSHLLRGEPLFSSAIIQSGLVNLCGVMSIDEYQVLYEKMLVELGIPLELPPAERVARFIALDTATVTAAMVPVFITPVITVGLCDDEVLIPRPIPTLYQYADFEVPEWCPRIMLGDCINECIIWNKAWDTLSQTPLAPGEDLSTPTAAGLIKKMAAYMGLEKTKIVADLYGITADMTNKQTFDVIERFTTHGMYSIPHYFAELAAPSVYAWHFDVPSAFDNAWGGMAHHSYDNVLVWGVLRHLLPEKQQRVGDEMTALWLRFANGEEPWEKFGENQKWMVFSEEGATLKSREEDKGRGYEIWDELHKHNIVGEFSEFSNELCIRRSDLLSRASFGNP